MKAAVTNQPALTSVKAIVLTAPSALANLWQVHQIRLVISNSIPRVGHLTCDNTSTASPVKPVAVSVWVYWVVSGFYQMGLTCVIFCVERVCCCSCRLTTITRQQIIHLKSPEIAKHCTIYYLHFYLLDAELV